MKRHKGVVFLILFVVLFLSNGLFAGENNPATPSQATKQFYAYNALLGRFVDIKGNVFYKGLSAEKERLESYLDFMSNNFPTSQWERDSSLCYWINLYNAATLNLILDHYPVTSIMKINGGNQTSF